MPPATHACSPLDETGPCSALAPGFFRLRYFFGKRLGVADLLDEQRYHAGKMRFHNRHLHGSGVLCGLGASLFEEDGTVLRIARGAALDACGHEIVVGMDQCIDVDAWFALERAERGESWPPADVEELRLCVTLTYRECATDPEPAPRDSCSCDIGGCDYGRIREEFALDLVEHSETATYAEPALFPDRAALEALLAGGGSIEDGLAALLRAGCGEPREDDRLVLACFTVRLDEDQEHVTEVVDIENTGALWSTGLIQELLRRHLGTLEAGALADGPAIVAAELRLINATSHAVVLTVDRDLVGATVAANSFAVRAFDAAAADPWTAPGSAVASYDSATREIRVRVPTTFLSDGGQYRVTLVRPAQEPIVDSAMRPLRPTHFALNFAAAEIAAGEFEMAPLPATP